MRGCPSDLELAALAAGDPEAEVWITHTADCPHCQAVLADLMSLQAEPVGPALIGSLAARAARPPSWARGWRAVAAAAALLVTAGVVWLQGGTEPRRAPPAPQAGGQAPPPALSPLPASGLWQSAGGDAERALGRSGYAALKRGGRALLSAEEGAVDLEEGALVVQSRGERVVVRFGASSVELEDGSLAAEVSGGALLASVLREAFAGEGALRVTVLEGSARLRSGTGEGFLRAGASASLSDSGFVACAPVAWRGPAWRALGNGLRAIRDAEEALIPSASIPKTGGYVLEALVRKRDPHAEVGVLFESAGRGWTLPLGDNVLPAGEAWRRIRVEVSGGWCRVTVGAREVLLLPEGRLGRDAEPGACRGGGLRAWAGVIEVREARWREP